MWLIPPSMRSACAPDTVVWTKDSTPPPSILALPPELWPMSSGKPMQRRSFSRAWKTKPWLRRLFGAAILDGSMDTTSVVALMPLSLASHASRTAWPAHEKASKTTGGSGPPSHDLLATLERGSWFAKTSQASFLPVDSLPFSQTWPRWGSVWSGECYQRPAWVPRTAASESSSWPTCRSSDGNKGGPNSRDSSGSLHLTSSAAQWQTPKANDSEKRGDIANDPRKGVVAQAMNWPTPASRDAKGANSELHCTETGGGRKHMDQLANFVAHSSPQALPTPDGPPSSNDGPTSPPRLNPAFVFWLMGMPFWWGSPDPISFAQQEMASWRCALRQRLSALCDGLE